MPDRHRARADSRVPSFLCLLLGALLVLASSAGARLAAQGKKPTRKAATWTVVKVGDKHRALLASDLGKLKKEIATENKAALAEWTKARAAARKNKEKFSDPRPKAVTVKTTGLKLASKEEAEERAEQLDAKRSDTPRKRPGTHKELWAAVLTASGGEVLPAKEARAFLKKAAKEHAEALQAWDARRKQAKREKRPFTEAKPSPPRVLGSRFPSRDAAEQALEKARGKKGS